MLNFRLASPAHLVDINRVEGLDKLEFSKDAMRIGATVRQRAVELAPDAALSYPLVARALPQVAHLQIRNRGTICGSLAHADAAAEMPTVMVALGATMVARSARGERLIPAASFFEFHLGTALQADELLVEVRLPAPVGRATGTFVEIARRAGDFALVGAAVQVAFGEVGEVSDLRVVCSGVAPVPFAIEGAAQLVVGNELRDELLIELQQLVGRSLDPPEDVHASAAYRRAVAGTLVRRALEQLRAEMEQDNG
jgi:carbon-monoxide dehydrogenase medium subunit